MTIAVDCRMINASGIGVYLRGCLPFFLQSGFFFLLIGSSKQLQSYESFSNAEIINCNVKTFSVSELFFFPSSIKKKINKANVFYSPFFNIPCGIKIPVYTTIHDIIFPDLPELTSMLGLIVRMLFFRRAYKKSKKIFTVSEFSKSRIEHHLGTQKQIIVTYSAIQSMFLEYRESVKNIQKKDTIVFTGNIKKHKGLYCLLDAFELARKEGLPHHLLIIGSNENLRSSDKSILKKIEAIGENAVTFTGFIGDKLLIEHISSSSLLVQPSLYEGFCLPPLEAMVLGTCVLISDIPVFKEVYGDYPVKFFRAGDSVDLKNKIMEMLKDKKHTILVLSKEQILKYNFEKTASTILKELK